MRRNAAVVSFGALLILLPPSAGCYQSTGLRILNFLGLQKQPVVLALVAESRAPGAPNVLEVVNPFLPYEPLQKKLTDVVGRPVALELCFPLQLEPNLRSGMYDLAIITPAQYGRFRSVDAPPVLAIAMDVPDTPARPALLVAQADSTITTIAELKGKSIAFGPAEDSRTHHAALELLARHGVRQSDLALEILPLPGSLRHLSDARSVAVAVLNGGVAAGLLDQAAWDALPERAEAANEPSRSRLRVLGRTIDVPDRLVVASPTLDEGAQKLTREFLYAARDRSPDVLKPLRCAGYVPPTAALLDACRQIVSAAPASDAAAPEPL